jgi:hypothetical protein
LSYWQSAPPFNLLANDELPTSIDFSPADHSLCFARVPSAVDPYEIQFELMQVPEPGSLWLVVVAGVLLGRCLANPARCWRQSRARS